MPNNFDEVIKAAKNLAQALEKMDSPETGRWEQMTGVCSLSGKSRAKRRIYFLF